jgi:hypothetical protein
LNEAATAARASRFCEGLLPERMWMLKPIPQTGVTDGPVEPSSPPHDRGHDGPQHVASDAAILRQRSLEVQPIFRQVARAAKPGRRSRFSGSPGLHEHLVAQSQPDRLRLAVLLWRHARRGRRSRAHPLCARATQTRPWSTPPGSSGLAATMGSRSIWRGGQNLREAGFRSTESRA